MKYIDILKRLIYNRDNGTDKILGSKEKVTEFGEIFESIGDELLIVKELHIKDYEASHLNEVERKNYRKGVNDIFDYFKTCHKQLIVNRGEKLREKNRKAIEERNKEKAKKRNI